MAIQLKQQLKLSQQLVMTPQLQQAIKLLQLNQLELVAVVEQELQENPCLEEEEREAETPGELSDVSPGEIQEQDNSGSSELDLTPEADSSSQEEGSGGASTESEGDSPLDPSDMEKINDVDWAAYMESQPQTGLEGRSGGAPKMNTGVLKPRSRCARV